MVCDHCGSDEHVTGYQNCPRFCTACQAQDHRRDTNACPKRACTKCGQTGHIARQCTYCDACKAHHAKGACICSTCGTHHRKDECPQDLCAYCEEFPTLKSAAQGSLHRHAPHVAQVRIKRPEHSIVQSTNARHARANSNQKATTISTARRARATRASFPDTYRMCARFENATTSRSIF